MYVYKTSKMMPLPYFMLRALAYQYKVTKKGRVYILKKNEKYKYSFLRKLVINIVSASFMKKIVESRYFRAFYRRVF